MSKLELKDLEAVREEMAAIYRCTKHGTLIYPHAKDLVVILKAIASVIRAEAEMDIEAELAAIREQIESFKKGESA